jgi:Flp pilus assembly pilin Flp
MIRLVQEEEGQDMVEYVLIFALVSIAALGAITLAGPVIRDYWALLSDKVGDSYP